MWKAKRCAAHRREAEKGLPRKGKSAQFAQRQGEEGPEHKKLDKTEPLTCARAHKHTHTHTQTHTHTLRE